MVRAPTPAGAGQSRWNAKAASGCSGTSSFRSPIFRLLHHARVRTGDAAMKADMHRDTARRYVAANVPRRLTRRVPERIHLMNLTLWAPLPRGAPSGARANFTEDRTPSRGVAHTDRSLVQLFSTGLSPDRQLPRRGLRWALPRVVAHLYLHSARVAAFSPLGQDEVGEVLSEPPQALREPTRTLGAPSPECGLDEVQSSHEADPRRGHTCLGRDPLGFVAHEVVGGPEAPELLRDARGLLLRVLSSRASITRLTSL